jgi:hypothetical protein
VLHGSEPAELARGLLRLVVQTWARVLNHKPRIDRADRSRVQIYSELVPTAEQIAQARHALRERLRKQRLAAQTRRARLDPAVRRILDEAFVRLGLDDPDGHLRDAIAAYPHDAVLAAVATFEGKRNAATLPPDATARYLLGIVRNITALLIDYIDHALATDRRLDRFFWLQAAADLASTQPSARHLPLFRTVPSRRVVRARATCAAACRRACGRWASRA